jgi:hypothetical protein
MDGWMEESKEYEISLVCRSFVFLSGWHRNSASLFFASSFRCQIDLIFHQSRIAKHQRLQAENDVVSIRPSLALESRRFR